MELRNDSRINRSVLLIEFCNLDYRYFVSHANLTPASGRQDHTTSPSASSNRPSSAPPASTASRSAFRDVAQRPSVGRDGEGYKADLGLRKTRIFLQRGLDRLLVICPSG